MQGKRVGSQRKRISRAISEQQSGQADTLLPEAARSAEGIHPLSDMWLPEASSAHVYASNPPALRRHGYADPAQWQREEGDVHPTFQPPDLPQDLKADQPIGLATSLGLRTALVFQTLQDETQEAFAREREKGNLFNFVPVMLAAGIMAYYAAPHEPQPWILLLSAFASGVFVFTARVRGTRWLFVTGAMLVFVGMVLAQWQVHKADFAVPLSDLTGHIDGKILAIDQNSNGSPRFLIRPVSIEGLSSGELPPSIRISSRSGSEDFKPGDHISGLARISPLNGPAYPGGYDFAFAARMNGLAMSGFFMGPPQISATIPDTSEGLAASLSLTVGVAVQSVREAISNRIRAGLPGEPGDVAVALITGDRSGLSDETQESLRRSGLAHILAISGLHMALVTLTVIWLVRLALAAIPGFVDRHPARKYAILAGFVTATAYLMISGQGIATVRAWLMISVMLTASLLDRRAITMRSVAIAAILILILFPASLFNPGFQMSFAAVAALVAVYREWSDYRLNRADSGYRQRSLAANIARGLTGWFGGLSTTSLVAGTATALFAMWHFHRVAPMGLISNLLAMPIVSIAVMPLALLVMFLMPYGFEKLALKPLGMAIEAVIDVSDGVNAYNLDFETGAQPVSVLVGSALFLAFACGLRTRLRLLSLLPLGVVMAGMAQKPELPDIAIAPDGRTIAVRTALLPTDPDAEATSEDALSLLYPRRGQFITDIWQRAWLPNQTFTPHPVSQGCDADGCRFDLKRDGTTWRVVLVYDPDQLPQACETSDILLAPRLWWARCRDASRPHLILNRADFEARGGHLLELSPAGIVISTAWNVPRSPFEAANARGLEADNELPPVRPWLARFDNISRRFAD